MNCRYVCGGAGCIYHEFDTYFVMCKFLRNRVVILSVVCGRVVLVNMWHNLSCSFIFTVITNIITSMLIRWCGAQGPIHGSLRTFRGD